MAAPAPAAAAVAAKKVRMPNEKEHKEKMDGWAKEIAALEAEMVRTLGQFVFKSGTKRGLQATLVTPKADEGKEVVKTKTPVQIKVRRLPLFCLLENNKNNKNIPAARCAL